MSLCNRLGFKLLKSVSLRSLGTQAAPAVQLQEEAPQIFRTKENNPANHNAQHLCKFYTVPEADVAPIIGDAPFPLNKMKEHIKTFNEWSILIRKPGLEIIDYLARTDYSKPVNKYVIYGEDGTGKSYSMYHVLHYAYATKKLILYVPWAQQWVRHPRECANSETKEGLVDLPIDAARFLYSFKNINAAVFPMADIRLTKSYEWGVDTFSEGIPIIEVINFGIDRIKYACDVVDALVDEVKKASIAGKCNTLVAIDGFNAFYTKDTYVKNDSKQKVSALNVSLIQSFLDMTKTDWCNGQIVITADKKAVRPENRESYLPRYLLTNEGFDHLDPYLPVSVENYSQDEFDTVIEYYKNRKWIRNISPEAKKELQLVCGNNPYKIMDYCKHL